MDRSWVVAINTYAKVFRKPLQAHLVEPGVPRLSRSKIGERVMVIIGNGRKPPPKQIHNTSLR
jgi:hypothetical protein